MMLPFRRRPMSQKLVSKTPTVEAHSSPSHFAELRLRHLDYDLQPLSVESLSHYIEPVVDDERFRVH